MTEHWPGDWGPKELQPTSEATPDDPNLTNDNGLLLLFGGTAEAYLWYEPDGCDVDTEPRP